MKHRLYILLVAALALSACKEEKEYVWAEPDDPSCLGVYFDSDNQRDFIFVPGESADVTIKMHRLNTAVAADVPIICECTTAGVTAPASVHFDAGSADATLVVNCDGLPVRQIATFKINVPDEYINHYAETLFNYESTALVSQWESANADGSPVKFHFTAYNYNSYNKRPNVIDACYEPVESEMEVLPGAGLIRIHNFINTGATITFALTPSPYSDFASYYRVSPRDHYYTFIEAFESEDYGDDWYNAWYLLGEDDDYAECDLFDLEGNESILDYPYFYWYSNSYTYEYSYAALKSSSKPFNSISMYISGTGDDNMVFPTELYLYFDWDGESGL